MRNTAAASSTVSTSGSSSSDGAPLTTLSPPRIGRGSYALAIRSSTGKLEVYGFIDTDQHQVARRRTRTTQSDARKKAKQGGRGRHRGRPPRPDPQSGR